jgi:hypothetical protein
MGSGNPPFFDARSGRNPLIACLNDFLKVKVRQHLFRHIRTEPNDAHRPH